MAEGSSRRPVCWSLHKYFKKAEAPADPPALADSDDQLVEGHLHQQHAARHQAVQALPKKEPSWLQKQLAEEAALQDSVDEVVSQQKAEKAQVQLVPTATPRKKKGGRAKKAPGAPKSPYKSMTGQQRVWAVRQVEDYVQIPGNSLKAAFERVGGPVKVGYCIDSDYHFPSPTLGLS